MIFDSRLTFRPMNYPWAYDYFVKSEQMHWTHLEVPMLEDIRDWQTKLTKDEKYFLTQIFRFFTSSDIDVAGAYVKSYMQLFPQPEVRMMLMSFAAREGIHVASYSHLIETLGMPESTYNEFTNHKEMIDKHNYFEDVLSECSTNPYDVAKQIAVFSAFTEGLQLFSSFVMLLNFPRRGLMKGMGQIISYSQADESLHVEAMLKVFKTIIDETPSVWSENLKTTIIWIAKKMVQLEDGFIDLSFKTADIEGITSQDIKSYIRFIADRRLLQMGIEPYFKVKNNPLPWVEEMLNLPTHSNFFETTVSDYSKGALSGSWADVWAQ